MIAIYYFYHTVVSPSPCLKLTILDLFFVVCKDKITRCSFDNNRKGSGPDSILSLVLKLYRCIPTLVTDTDR